MSSQPQLRSSWLIEEKESVFFRDAAPERLPPACPSQWFYVQAPTALHRLSGLREQTGMRDMKVGEIGEVEEKRGVDQDELYAWMKLSSN